MRFRIFVRAGGRIGLASQGRTGQAGRGQGRMSVRPYRPWWYHISGHYPCVYAEIETSKLNIRQLRCCIAFNSS